MAVGCILGADLCSNRGRRIRISRRVAISRHRLPHWQPSQSERARIYPGRGRRRPDPLCGWAVLARGWAAARAAAVEPALGDRAARRVDRLDRWFCTNTVPPTLCGADVLGSAPRRGSRRLTLCSSVDGPSQHGCAALNQPRRSKLIRGRCVGLGACKCSWSAHLLFWLPPRRLEQAPPLPFCLTPGLRLDLAPVAALTG